MNRFFFLNLGMKMDFLIQKVGNRISGKKDIKVKSQDRKIVSDLLPFS